MIYKSQRKEPNYVTPQTNLIFKARLLWRDLATWFREYLITLFLGAGNLELESNRLYRIPLEYGNLLRVFYGDQIAEQYITLLSNYIITFESLFTALQGNDVNVINEATMRLYQNANERAAFLARINPFWTESEWQSLMYSFTQMTIDQATTFLTGDYTRNIEIYDRILSLTSLIGDYFSEGLINYLNYYQPQQMQPDR